ncbi:MAG: ATP-binding protein [Pseudomonadota bacterium]
MNTLFARLSLALLLIVGLMGGAFFVVERVNTRAYYEELTQRLNSPIAMYVTGQRQLIRDGVADLASLHELAAHAMVINPTAEIYLLDADGRIIGHGLSDDALLEPQVDLAPIRQVIAGNVRLPLLGDDPRSGSSQKVFSASEVIDDGQLAGYLYVVLGGKTYEALASDIGGSYVGKTTALALLLIVLAAGSVGVVVFNLLTRRLQRLSAEVSRVSSSGFAEQPRQIPTRRDREGKGNGDEIDELAANFVAMSARIAEQIEQLEENDRLRRELVSNISHDLRTPLAAMQGYLETLIIKGERLDATERQHYLRVARKHTVRLSTLIGDLFELSKLDTGHTAPDLEAFSLQELVQDVLQEFQLEADKRGIELCVEFDTDGPQTVGDIGLIQRVLENLVRNAVKFTPDGGEVVVRIAEQPDSMTVAVCDTGPGIADQDLPRIFDRFYRAVDGEEARSDSSGLGLAIVKRILDLHQSRISVSSRSHVGTRFEFELPVYRQAA